MKARFMVIAAAFFMFVSANAQTVPQVQKNEHKRIKDGVKSGELTKGETKKLVAEQKDIHQDIKEAKADGTVTTAERKEIRKDERKANRDIYRAKHNNRKRH